MTFVLRLHFLLTLRVKKLTYLRNISICIISLIFYDDAVNFRDSELLKLLKIEFFNFSYICFNHKKMYYSSF